MDEMKRVRGAVIQGITRLGLMRITSDPSSLTLGGENQREFTEELRQLRVREVESGAELVVTLDTLCSIYLQATSIERKNIRVFAQHDRGVLDWLTRYAGVANSKLKRTKDAKWLEKGLAALSIVDQRIDFRDIYFSLGALYISAEQAGLQPAPYFSAVGDLSNTELNPLIAQLPTRDFIGDFPRSPFFKESVLPKLDQASNSNSG